MEFRRPRHQQTARSTRPNGMCNKHPKHQQSPGVCSICLTEKLSQLSSSSSRSNTTATTVDSSCSSSSLSSLSSSHYSASASSCSSPVHSHHYRMTSDGRGLSSLSFFRSGRNVLTKSRSVAFITRRRDAGEVIAMDHGKKKSGFWSKLLRPRSKRTDEGLVHSRTVTRVH
ncbi:unnamed protein product [Coffea canephora]|uniref:Uncharacterized protein n=1 Tax=Coffea canephora TaxID=49390 RepID=A0A068TXW9_COFCA|nr:unnamed protein product [Coffea canephora]